MVHVYISPEDKLARQICKAVIKGVLGASFDLAAAVSVFVAEKPDAIGGALVHGVHQGWLAKGNNSWSTTDLGEEIGRRSRAGVVKKRRT